MVNLRYHLLAGIVSVASMIGATVAGAASITFDWSVAGGTFSAPSDNNAFTATVSIVANAGTLTLEEGQTLEVQIQDFSWSVNTSAEGFGQMSVDRLLTIDGVPLTVDQDFHLSSGPFSSLFGGHIKNGALQQSAALEYEFANRGVVDVLLIYSKTPPGLGTTGTAANGFIAQGNGAKARFTAHDIVPEPAPCDFESDGDCDFDDVDLLVTQGNLVIGLGVPPADAKFDLDASSTVDTGDLDQWLADAATVNGFVNPYLRGDADIDHVVDLNDASSLVANFGTASGAKWSQGDFEGDGDVDLNDASSLVANFGNTDPDTAGASGDAEWTFDAVVNALSTTITVDATDQAFLSTEALDGAVLTLTQQAVPFSIPQAGPGVQVGEFMTANFVDGQEQILVEVAGPGVYTFEARWNVAGGTEQSTVFTIEFIPEPASLMLLGIGGLLVLRRH